MSQYEITGKNLELPHGERFTIKESAPVAGDLCLIRVGQRLLIGRWIPGWIIQPGRWIRLTSDVIVKLLGLVMLFVV